MGAGRTSRQQDKKKKMKTTSMTQYWEQVDGLNVRQDSNIYIAGTLQAGWTRGASQKQFPSGDVLLHSNGLNDWEQRKHLKLGIIEEIKKKTLMNYCNWLLSYYKLVFLKYNSSGVFQWWFKGFAVNKRSTSLQEKVLTPSCKQVINTGVHRQRPASDNLLTRGESAPLTAGLNCSSTPHADCWLSKGASL